MVHLTTQQLSASLDGLLTGPSLEIVDRHLDACEMCRRERADLELQDELLEKLLTHEPTHSFFDKFAEDLDELIRTDGASGRRRASAPTPASTSAAAPAKSRPAPAAPRRSGPGPEPPAPTESRPIGLD